MEEEIIALEQNQTWKLVARPKDVKSISCKWAYEIGNPRTQSYGYVKYRISNHSKKGRETDTQFKVSKQNSILDLLDTYRILWKAVFDESRMYGLEGDLSYLSRSTLQYGVKKPK